MGNERSGRGGIPSEKFDRAVRLAESGIEPHRIAREVDIDRKTAAKIAAGEHIYQTEGKLVACPVCRRRVTELPCQWCLSTPLEVEPIKLNPTVLTAELFERDETAEEMFAELVRSVGQLGMLQPPLVVRLNPEEAEELGSEWLIVLGGKRVRAAIEAGLPTILCLEVRANRQRQYDALLTEEFLRVDRNPIERGRLFGEALADPAVAHTQKTLGERIGKSQSYVAHHVNLLKLPDYWQDLLITRVLSEAHVRCLLPHSDNGRLLAEVWRDLDRSSPPTVKEFRGLVESHLEQLAEEAERRKAAAEEGGDSPLDELIKLPTAKRRGPATKDVKFKFAADVAENLLVRLDAIGDAEGCESREETLERLIDFYWSQRPGVGMRRVA